MSIIFADVILSPRIRIICPVSTELDVTSNAPFISDDDSVCMSSTLPVVNDDVSVCVSFNKVPSVISRPFTSTILALAIKLDSALP